MKLIYGKTQLLNTLEALIIESNINKLIICGVLDKDILKEIDNNYIKNNKLQPKFIISEIEHQQLIVLNNFSHINRNIRVSSKCKYQCIILNNCIFFLSGNCGDKECIVKENDLIIFINNYPKIANELENILLEHWNNGLALEM